MRLDDRPSAAADDWMALVERTLRGRGLADLATTTRDGIEVRALYTAGPDRPLAAGAVATQERAELGWDIRACHRLDSNLDADEGAAGSGSGPDTGSSALAALRKRIDDDLAGGAASLEFDAGEGVSGDGLAGVLAGVDLARTPVAFAPHGSLRLAGALGTLAVRGGTRLMRAAMNPDCPAAGESTSWTALRPLSPAPAA